MTESAEQKRTRLAGEALRQAKDSITCQHPRDSRSTDLPTGREFCVDCGAFTDGGPQNV